ncbi:MAG: TIGR03936 family radical SAM-associated protein, partial [Nitrospira sp.]|nr:TIGR03936 family radical SAM-associated protein [Nitrospira sp.]
MRMLSQLEIITTYARAFRRASVPVMFSEGFHPHPKMSFGPALPVGVESICEYMDAELTCTVDPELFKKRVNGP